MGDKFILKDFAYPKVNFNDFSNLLWAFITQNMYYVPFFLFKEKNGIYNIVRGKKNYDYLRSTRTRT